MAAERKPTRSKTPGLIKRGSIYYCDFMFKGRRIQKRLSGDRATAEKMLRAERARLDLGSAGIVDQSRKYEELKELYLADAKIRLRSWKTYEADLKRIEKVKRFHTIEEITPAFVVQYRTQRTKDGVSKRSINREISALSAMLTWGVKMREIGYNPLSGVPALENDQPRKVRRCVTIAEANAILDNAPPNLRPMFLLMLTTGMRRSEAVELRFSDINWQTGVITVTAENAKSKKRRFFPVTSEVLEQLRQLRDEAESRQVVKHQAKRQNAQQAANFSRDHVFVTAANTPWRNNLLRKFRDTCERAGIADGFDPEEARSFAERRRKRESGASEKRPRKHLAVDIHCLRKTFSAEGQRRRGSPKTIQAMLGHSTLELTMNVYGEANVDDMRAVVDALPYGKRGADA